MTRPLFGSSGTTLVLAVASDGGMVRELDSGGGGGGATRMGGTGEEEAGEREVLLTGVEREDEVGVVFCEGCW